jgi:uncharacterized membrane protein YqjE
MKHQRDRSVQTFLFGTLILLLYAIGGLATGLAGYVALLLTGGGSLMTCLGIGLALGLLFGIWRLVQR